jgi:hypothetical protein
MDDFAIECRVSRELNVVHQNPNVLLIIGARVRASSEQKHASESQNGLFRLRK